MKKLSIFILIVCSLFLISACGNKNDEPNNNENNNEQPVVKVDYNFLDVKAKFSTPYNFTIKRTMIGAMNGTAFEDKVGSTLEVTSDVLHFSNKLNDIYAKTQNNDIKSLIFKEENTNKLHEHFNLSDYEYEANLINSLYELVFLNLDNNDFEKGTDKLVLTNLSKLQELMLTDEAKSTGITIKVNEASLSIKDSNVIYYVDYVQTQSSMVSKYKVTYEFSKFSTTTITLPQYEKFYTIDDVKGIFEEAGYFCTPSSNKEVVTLICTKDSDGIIFTNAELSNSVSFYNLYYSDATPGALSIINSLK